MIAVAQPDTCVAPSGDAAALIADAEKAVAAAGAEPSEVDAGKIGLQVALATIEAAEADLNAALSRDYPTTWDYVAAKYEAALKASNACGEVYPDAEWENAHDICSASKPIIDVLHSAIGDLSDTDAPSWPGLALKTRALVAQYGGEPGSPWMLAASSFISAAEALGNAPREDLDFQPVLQARGHAETLAYHMAHDSDGYAGWAWTADGAVAKVSALVETILRESRAFAKATPAQFAMSKAVIEAVWFGRSFSGPSTPPAEGDAQPVQCRVEAASDHFATALRMHLHHECRDGAFQEPEAKEKSDAAWSDLKCAEAEALRHVPTTRAGVAFQLLVACGELDFALAGDAESVREAAADNVRAAIVNAIGVLGLPFDRAAAAFYVGSLLDRNDGRDRQGAFK